MRPTTMPGSIFWSSGGSPSCPGTSLRAHFLDQRVRHFEVRINVLHVIAVIERLDQLENLFTGLVVERDRVLRFPQHRRLARLAKLRFERLGNIVESVRRGDDLMTVII